MVDPIANLIIKLKNANQAGHSSVSAPYSKMSEAILDVLAKEGYVKNVTKKGKKVVKSIEADFVYGEDKRPKIEGVERLSKFSKRIYYGSKNLRSVRSGFGHLILTTPKGIMTGKEAKKEKVGGEALFKIW